MLPAEITQPGEKLAMAETSSSFFESKYALHALNLGNPL